MSAATRPPGPGLRLLPTPVGGAFNDTESVESWLARRDRQKRLGRNGNGIGTPLAIAIRLLPTPMASDGAAERSPQLGGQRPSGAKRQVGLPEVIAHHLACLPPGNSPVQAASGRERLRDSRRAQLIQSSVGQARLPRSSSPSFRGFILFISSK